MLKLTAGGGASLWINLAEIKAMRYPVPAELEADKSINAVIFVTSDGWHVRETPEMILKAMAKL
jgi:hypothetical protein